MCGRAIVCVCAHSSFMYASPCVSARDRYIATGGDDGLLKFWDLRKPDAAVAVLAGHSHWWVFGRQCCVCVCVCGSCERICVVVCVMLCAGLRARQGFIDYVDRAMFDTCTLASRRCLCVCVCGSCSRAPAQGVERGIQPLPRPVGVELRQ